MSSHDYRTQRITEADLKGGRIRIPYMNAAKTKSLFPKQKEQVTLLLKGNAITCSWNPRMGPDKERSGLLQVGTRLIYIVDAEEVLTVSLEDGVYHIE